MNLYHFANVIWIGMLLPVAVSKEHTSKYTSTEDANELDFSKDARVKESTSTLFVGGFQLAVEDESTREACDLIEDQFILRTDCSCNRSILQSSRVEFGCKNKLFVCDQQEYCAQPVYTGTVGFESPRFSADFCLNNLQKDGEHFGNLCIAIDGSTIGTDTKIKRCLAQVGKTKCDCAICGEGSGVQVDCTDVDSRLISRNCDVVNIPVVAEVKQQKRKVSGFFPSFES